MEDLSLSTVLRNLDEFQLRPDLAELALDIFEYTQFLLDKDENLTKTGNLNSNAVSQLEQRIEELIGIAENPEDEIIDA